MDSFERSHLSNFVLKVTLAIVWKMEVSIKAREGLRKLLQVLLRDDGSLD